MTTSVANPVLNLLRSTAETLGKPQSVVAANWMRRPQRKYSPTRNLGITRSEYNEAQAVILRLANATA